MVQFLVTNLFYVPDISDEGKWGLMQKKMRRDFPWLLRNHDVSVSGIGQGWSGWRKREQIASHAGFSAMPFGLLNAALAWLTHFRDALRLAGKGSVGVLAPTPESGLGAVLAKILVGKPIRLIVRVQGHTASKALNVKRSRLRFKLLKNIERLVIRWADLVVPMGTFTCELALVDGARPGALIVLPFPVSWADRAEVTDSPARPTVLFAGRLEKEKGVQILLEAMALVKKRVPDAHLLIAGDGSYRSALEQTADSAGIRDKVTFLGWLQASDLQQAYRNSFVLAMPSIWEEGLGMVLVEAGLMGRPVVASDIGGIRDVVRHGENGLLVPPGEALALADALMTVLLDRGLASQMGFAGSRIAREYLEGREEALERVRQAIYRLVGDETK